MKFINLKYFYFCNHHVKTFFNFEKEWCTFDKKKKPLKRKPSCDTCLEHAKGFLKHHESASSFKQWNFINNGT